MSDPAPAVPDAQRSGTADWWIRTGLVLSSPRAVFAALRDDSDQAASDRAEPVLLVILLAGMAAVLATPDVGRLLDDPNVDDSLVVAVTVFLGGGLYGGFLYWVLGAGLYGGLVALGSHGSYRRARHLLAFAAVPVALSLALLPVKLALYGDDLFHRGGSDSGAGGAVFALLSGAFLAWTIALLVIGVRVLHGWTWARAAAGVAIAVGLQVAIVAVLNVL
jgi:hypothetical protein